MTGLEIKMAERHLSGALTLGRAVSNKVRGMKGHLGAGGRLVIPVWSDPRLGCET